MQGVGGRRWNLGPPPSEKTDARHSHTAETPKSYTLSLRVNKKWNPLPWRGKWENLSWPWHQGKGKEQLCREFLTLCWSQVAVCSEFILPMWPQKALCVECNLKWFQVGGAPGWLAEANTNPLWRDSGYKEKWKVPMKWSSLEETLKFPCTLRRRKVWDARRNGEQKYC